MRLHQLRCLAVLLFIQGGAVLAQDETIIERTVSLSHVTFFQEIPLRVPTGSQVEATMRGLAVGLDALLLLVNARDEIIASNDDDPNDPPHARLTISNLEGGDYRLVATRFDLAQGTSEGDFALRVVVRPTPKLAPYDLSAEALAAAGYPVLHARPLAEWTILAYYGGDNNLEAALLADFNEFERAGGSTEQVRVVAFLDRSPRFSAVSGDWSGARLYEIGPDVRNDADPLHIDSALLADLGQVNSADGQTLAQFLAWAMRAYPAKRYALALGSHGDGWLGVITDDTQGGIISLPQFGLAMESVRALLPNGRFDLIVNDACFMASVEFLAILARYARYTLASAEVVLNPALDMTTFVWGLQDGNLSLPDLGRELINLYIERDMAALRDSRKDAMTSAMIDLDAYKRLLDDLEAFAAFVNANPAPYAVAISQALQNVYAYAERTKIDLGDFLEQVTRASDDLAFIEAAQRARQSLNVLKLAQNAGAAAILRTRFLNIYFPAYLSDFRTLYQDQSPLPQWQRMLRNYYAMNEPSGALWTRGDTFRFHPAIAPSLKITRAAPPQTVRPDDRLSLDVEIVGRKLAEVRQFIDAPLDGPRRRLTSAPLSTLRALDDGRLQAVQAWTSGVAKTRYDLVPLGSVFSDGVRSSYELLSLSLDGQQGTLEGRYRESPDDPWIPVSVVYERRPDGNFAATYALSRSPQNLGAAAIDIPLGADFQVLRAVVAEGCRTLPSEGPVFIWPEGGLHHAWTPLPPGDYQIGFIAQTFGDSCARDSVTLRLDANAPASAPPQGESGAWRLFRLGYDQRAQLPVPRAWLEYSFDDGFWSGFGADPNIKAATTFLRFAQVRGTDAAAIRDEVLATFINDPSFVLEFSVDEVRPYYGDNFAWQVALYSARAQTILGEVIDVQGRLYATTTPQGFTYLIWAETPRDDPQAADELFSTLIEPMVDGFAIPDETRLLRDRAWGFELRYPRTWAILQGDETVQVSASPDERLRLRLERLSRASDDPQEVAAAWLNAQSLAQDDAARLVNVNGKIAYSFRYRAPEGLGLGLLAFHASDSVQPALLIALQGPPEQAEPLFARLLAQLAFFDGPPAAQEASALGQSYEAYRVERRDEFSGFSLLLPESYTPFETRRYQDGVEQWAYSPTGNTAIVLRLTSADAVQSDGRPPLEVTPLGLPLGRPQPAELGGRLAVTYPLSLPSGLGDGFLSREERGGAQGMGQQAAAFEYAYQGQAIQALLKDGRLLTLAVVGLPGRSELDYADFAPSIFQTGRFDLEER
ncbi:MAG: clostripain-related cysteine peptidase [Anaerolineae bacterium]|nr:clostripain-related cysteine peptidase [Anaerolineae bacterium]MDW8171164.1 clostripain-related cysteine peptidase [Anaerolineae bacterium]